MYARVSTFQCLPGKLDELVKEFNETVFPANRRQAGHVGSYLLTDAPTNRVMVITLWDTQATLDESAAGFYQSQVDRVRPFISGHVSREQFDVKAHV
jgi:heme-degrading monooxygenase HmoA